MKIVLNVIVYLGCILILLGVAMFFYGVHMFTARGEFSDLERNLGEISIALWIPTIFGGLIITATGFIVKGIRRGKMPAKPLT